LNSVVALTADYNLCSLDIVPEQYLRVQRQLIGCSDDILDILVVPKPQPEESLDSASPPYRIAVIANSTQIQILEKDFSSTALYGHTDIVLAVDASVDGKWIVTSSKDKTCRVWDLSTTPFSCFGIADGHNDAVGSVCISKRLTTYQARNVMMVSGGSDKVLKVWPVPVARADSLRELLTDPIKLTAAYTVRAHDKDINTVVMSPNDAMVASGSQDSSIRLWKTSDLTPIATLTGHKRGVWRVAFSPIDKCLASCSGDRTVKLWSMADFSCLRTFQGHTSSVLSVKFINNGMQLISGAADGLIRLWTIRTGECENTFDQHSDKVWALSVGLDGKTFFSAGSDSKLLEWSDSTEQEERYRLQKCESVLALEQQLNNNMRNKRYDVALDIALELGHSNKVLHILNNILDVDQQARGGSDKSGERVEAPLDKFVKSWSDERISHIFEYLKDWNTNSRYSFVSQSLLNTLIRVIRVDRLTKIKEVALALPGLLAYTERHFQRLDRLHEATYLLEYMSSQMSVLPIENSMIDTNKEKDPKDPISRKRVLEKL